MTIRVAEVERLNACRVRIPIGQPLWAGRDMLYMILPKDAVGSVHIAHDDGHVLEGEIIAARIGWNRYACGTNELNQFDALVTQFEFHRANPRVRNSVKLIDRAARALGITLLLKRQDSRIKLHRAIDVCDSHHDRTDLEHREGVLCGRLRGEQDWPQRNQERCCPDSPRYPT